MLISTKGRYAIRIMIELAQMDNQVYTPLKEIAEQEEISEKYLESIVGQLSKAGIVEGVRGKGGGYKMKQRPSEVTVREILQITDGSLAPVSCLKEGAEPCGRADRCKTLPMWKTLYENITDCLDSITLDDLINCDVSGIIDKESDD